MSFLFSIPPWERGINRWIESERSQALLGNQYGKIEQGSIYHMDDAFLGFGSGPRVCPGKVIPSNTKCSLTWSNRFMVYSQYINALLLSSNHIPPKRSALQAHGPRHIIVVIWLWNACTGYGEGWSHNHHCCNLLTLRHLSRFWPGDYKIMPL